MEKPVIIFDFFGVISSEVSSIWRKKYFSEEEFKKIKTTLILSSDKGEFSHSILMERLGEIIGKDSMEVQKEWESHVVLNQEVILFIQDLKKEHTIVLCSNASSGFLIPILEQNNLIELFDHIIISSEIGIVKPDIRIFSITLDRAGIVAQDAIFIDDNKSNIEAAKSVGIDSYLFTDSQNLKEVLSTVA